MEPTLPSLIPGTCGLLWQITDCAGRSARHAGLVTSGGQRSDRHDVDAVGPCVRVLPTRLTPRGRQALDAASAAVRSVEKRMLSGMTDAEQAAALASLRSMIEGLQAEG